MDQRRVD